MVTLIPEDEAKNKRIAAANSETARAAILDRNNVVLASSLTTASLFANATQIDNPEEVAKALADIFYFKNAHDSFSSNSK